MSVFKPIKATSLPGTPAPDAVYFIKAGSSAIVRIYVTDSTGTAYLVGQIVDSPFTPTNTAVTVGDTFQTIAEKLQGQVTNIAQNYLQLSGGTMTGYISLHADPTQAFHAATKQYVDNVAEGLHIHASVKVATTTTLASASGGTVTYNNGTNGLGATLTLSNALTQLDGYSLVNGDRVLIKNETNKAHNGLYVRTSSTVFTRASDYDTVTEIKSGDFVFVSEGVQGGKTGWVQISSVSTIGTDNIEWQQFSGAGTYVGSTSIVLNANSFERAALIGDVTSAQNSNTLTIANNAVSNEKFRQSSGFSVVGRTATGTGNVADIVAGTDGVLRRSGSGDLAFGTLVTNNIGDSQITYAKIQNVTADRILGRITTNGVAQELTATQVRTLLNVADGANNYVLPTATSTVLGGIEIFSDTVQSVASNAVSATASRTYGIQLNSSGQAVVNVPWANTEYTGSTSIILTGGSFERAALTGDVTATQNSNATTIASKAVTYAKIQDVATSRMLGRVTAGAGIVEELTASQVRSFLNVADGADNYSSWLLAASGTAGTASITSGATVTLTAGTGMTVTRSSNNVTFATTITQYTDALARTAISLTTTGTSGAATYDNSTGVLNIPQYQTALTNPVTGTGVNGRVAFWNGTGTITSNSQFLWDNTNSNLSLNTSVQTEKLNVGGSVHINTDNNGLIIDAGSNKRVGFFKYFGIGGGVISRISTATFSIGRLGTTDIKDSSGYTANLFFSAADLIGVSTTSPTETLDVNGNIRVRSLLTTEGDFVQANANGVLSRRTAAQVLTQIGAQAALTNPVTGTGTSGQIAFWNGTTTQTGDSKLTFNSSTGLLTLDGDITLTGAQTIQTSTGNLTLATGGGDGNIILTPNGTGSVLVNTTTASSFKLDVNGTARVQGALTVTTGGASITGLSTIRGTSASDSAQLGSELLTTGTGDASWTGSSFATGYTHVAGSTTTLTSTLAGVVNSFYQIAYTVTGRTAGSFTIAFGGFTSSALTATGAVGPRATTTDTLVIAPTSDFNGTIVLSIKVISASSASVTLAGSNGTAYNEIRTHSGNANTFIGRNSGRNNTTGQLNSFYGVDAGQNNTTGSNNTFIGRGSGNSNTTGGGNVFLGVNSGFSNLAGSSNTFLGAASGFLNTGEQNVFIGEFSARELTNGSNNTFIGRLSGYLTASSSLLTTADNSIFIGHSTRANDNSQTNQIVIGYQVTGLGSNTTVIGNSSTTFGRWFGNLLLGTSTNSGDRLRVDGTVRFDSVTNATGDIVTIDANNVLRRRTAAQILTDIGAQTALTNPVTGTGANGQVSFWTGTGTQAGDNNLFWDNTNKRLGIGTTSPRVRLEVSDDLIISKSNVWTARTTPNDGYQRIAYGNGLFVAIGTNFITSSDGINWTSRTVPIANWTSITYGNGLFVAVSTSNIVATSPDGITWTSRTNASSRVWRGVTYGNGLFVAVASSGTGNRVATSPDGITWTSRTTPIDNDWRAVTYGNGLFVAVARIGTGTGNRVMTSPDGITWTLQTSASDSIWEDITYGKGLFVASGGDGSIMTSPDGINWTSRTAPTNDNYHGVTYGNGLFVAVRLSGGATGAATSVDGITWVARSLPTTNAYRGIAYGNGIFVAVSSTGTDNRVATSGAVEQTLPTPINRLNGDWYYTGNLIVGAITTESTQLLQVAGTVALRASSTASAATQIPVFTADPASTTRELVTRTPTQFRGDIGAAAIVHTHVVSDIVSLTAKRLIGRHTNSTGAGEQISLANNLAISDAGVLSVEWVETAW